MMQDNQKKAIAYHEAGHVVVAHELGGTIECVKISFGEEWSGNTVIQELEGDSERATYYAAGAIAQEKGIRGSENLYNEVGDQQEITAAEGDGPVSALDNALRKALNKFFLVDLEQIHLVDFKVRVIDGRDGTSAKVRVFIDSRDQEKVWSTVGVSQDIIEASWQALEDSFQYKLSHG